MTGKGERFIYLSPLLVHYTGTLKLYNDRTKLSVN